MPSQWDHKADKDLLLAIIDDGQLKSISWPSIAAKMKAKNYTFSHEACRQHFQKIRKESKTSNGSNPSTPSKPRTTSTNGKRKTPGSSKSASFTNGNEYDEDDEELGTYETPSKKRNGVKKEEDLGQTATAFKIEEMDGNGTAVVDLEHDDLYDGEA